MHNPQVIVVGSGPSGVSVAWPLVQAGIRVLMLDGADRSSFDSMLQGTIGQARRQGGLPVLRERGLTKVSPKLSTPLAVSVMHGYAERMGLDARGFSVLGGLAEGGLSRLWGAAFPEMSAGDIACFPDGAGMMESHARVCERIGVCEAVPYGAVADVMDRSPSDGFSFEPARNAVLDGAREGRGHCNRCGLCLWGCARGSIYRTPHDISKLAASANFRLRLSSLVVAVRPDGEGHRVVTETGETMSAPIVVLGCGTIASTALVLRRLGCLGQPVRFLSNPVAAKAFVVPRRIGEPLPEGGFSLAQAQYRLPLEEGGEAFGMLYGADCLPPHVLADRLPCSRPLALRLARAVAPALVLATCYLPGDFSDNTITVLESAVAVQGSRPPQSARALALSLDRLSRHLRRRGAWAVPGSMSLSEPGADGHYAATLPMGGTSVLSCSWDGQVRGLPGLFLADGSALPRLPARHCTSLIMANADRIGRALAARVLSSP